MSISIVTCETKTSSISGARNSTVTTSGDAPGISTCFKTDSTAQDCARWAIRHGRPQVLHSWFVPGGKVLDVNAGSGGLAGKQQWTANGGTNQMWYLRPTGDGYHAIVSHDSGLLGAASRRNQRRGTGHPVDRRRRGSQLRPESFTGLRSSFVASHGRV
jgi:hypothetical protein